MSQEGMSESEMGAGAAKADPGASSPYRIASVREGGGDLPSDKFWGRRTHFAIGEFERIKAMTEGVRLCAECLKGADPLAGASPPWSDESWEEMNQVFSTCAAVLGRSMGALIFAGARPRANGRDGLVFSKKSWGRLQEFFKIAMMLPKPHFEMAVWSLMDAACEAHPACFTAPKSNPFFPAPHGARGIIERMAEAASAMQTTSFDAVGAARDKMMSAWRVVKTPYGPKDGPYIGLAHIGVPDAWPSCSEMLEAFLVKEELLESTRRRKNSKAPEAQTPPRL